MSFTVSQEDKALRPKSVLISVMCGLGSGGLGHRRALSHRCLDHLNTLTNGSQLLLVLSYTSDELLEMAQGLGRIHQLPQVLENRFDLGEDKQVLTGCVVEHLFVNGAVVHQRCCHVPVRGDHAQMSAVFAEHRFHVLVDGGWVKGKKPIARFAHGCFASQVIELQNQICVCLFTHCDLLM